MSANTALTELQNSIRTKTLTKTATATLTDKEVLESLVIYGNHASTDMTFTLPPGDAANKGAINLIVNQAAAVVKVYEASGFGGAGASYDTFTLAQGEFAIVMSNGTYWYELHNEPAGAS